MLAVELQCLFVLLVHGQCKGEMVLLDELYEACVNALRLVIFVYKQPCNVVAVNACEACNLSVNLG